MNKADIAIPAMCLPIVHVALATPTAIVFARTADVVPSFANRLITFSVLAALVT